LVIMSFDQTINELRYGGPQVRIRAATFLAEANNPQVTPYLLEALKDEDAEVRIAVAHALNTYRDPQAVPTLIQLLNDKNFAVNASAATTLGLTGDERAVKPLLHMVERVLRFGPNILVQHQAIVQGLVALGRIRDERATGLLIKMLKKGYRHSVSDWQLQVRQAAALGLGLLDQPAGNQILIDTLTDDEPADLLESLTTALGMLRSEQSFKMMAGYLRFAPFENENKLFRRQQGLIIALGQRGDRAAVPYLLPLVTSVYPEVRIALTETLVRLGETEQGDALIPLLRDRSSDVRTAAATALGALGVQSAAGPLSAVAVDPDRRVAGAAQNALENIKALPSAQRNIYLPPAPAAPPEGHSTNPSEGQSGEPNR
jgi:HEAT repeat protein